LGRIIKQHKEKQKESFRNRALKVKEGRSVSRIDHLTTQKENLKEKFEI
jgi:hypothetical protein